MKNYIALFVAVVFALCSAPSGHCQAYSALTTKLKNNQVITGNETVQGNGTYGGTLTVGGLTTLSTPLTIISAENAVTSKLLSIDVGANAALANSTTYISSAPFGRAMKVINITASAATAPIGGTNTVSITKNGSTTLLSTANIDPTTMTNNTGKILTLTGTPANLVFAPTDTVTVTWVTGVQATAAIGPSITLEVVPTADY